MRKSDKKFGPDALYFLLRLRVPVMAVPERDNVLVLPDAYSTSAHFWPLPWRDAVLVAARTHVCSVDDALELVTDDGKNEVLPQPIRDALSKADDPLAA